MAAQVLHVLLVCLHVDEEARYFVVASAKQDAECVRLLKGLPKEDILQFVAVEKVEGSIRGGNDADFADAQQAVIDYLADVLRESHMSVLQYFDVRRGDVLVTAAQLTDGIEEWDRAHPPRSDMTPEEYEAVLQQNDATIEELREQLRASVTEVQLLKDRVRALTSWSAALESEVGLTVRLGEPHTSSSKLNSTAFTAGPALVPPPLRTPSLRSVSFHPTGPRVPRLGFPSTRLSTFPLRAEALCGLRELRPLWVRVGLVGSAAGP